MATLLGCSLLIAALSEPRLVMAETSDVIVNSRRGGDLEAAQAIVAYGAERYNDSAKNGLEIRWMGNADKSISYKWSEPLDFERGSVWDQPYDREAAAAAVCGWKMFSTGR